MVESKFIIKNKNYFLLTYSNDFNGCLTVNVLINFFSSEPFKSLFDYVIAQETGHQSGDVHDHFHVYLQYKGTNAKGFSTRALNYFDVPLDSYTSDNGTVVLPYDLNGNLHPKAHPNISFSSSKKRMSRFYMLNYVTKQKDDLPKEDCLIFSNIEWENLLDKLKSTEEDKQMKNVQRFSKSVNKENLLYNFYSWIRSLLIDKPELTKKQLLEYIKEDNDKWYAYCLNINNSNTLINQLFTFKPSIKPTPHYEYSFIIPRELFDYINLILEPWVKGWYTDKSLLPQRPKGLFLSGESRTGKTSLMTLIGSFSYFKNIWNAMNYEPDSAYNIFDDMDQQLDNINDFTYLKPWFGSQETITITDKWVKKTEIRNGKPLIYLSNYSLDEICKNEYIKSYIRKNMYVIHLKEDLFTPKNTSTIGGFTSFVRFDPKTLWYYKNFINSESENGEPNTDNLDPENDVLEPVLLSDTGRPSKRSNPFAIQDSDAENRNKKAKNLFG